MSLNNQELKVYEYIKNQCRENGFPPAIREICDALGFKSTSTVHMYIERLKEKGYLQKTDMKKRAIKPLCDNTSNTKSEIIDIPLVGQVAAGVPILAEENIEDTFSIPVSFMGKNKLTGNTFMLKVKGDSMIEVGIHNGDYIIVKEQPDALNGEMIVALIDNEATVKTFYKEKEYIRLQPENSSMEPIIVKNAKILGKVVGLFRNI